MCVSRDWSWQGKQSSKKKKWINSSGSQLFSQKCLHISIFIFPVFVWNDQHLKYSTAPPLCFEGIHTHQAQNKTISPARNHSSSQCILNIFLSLFMMNKQTQHNDRKKRLLWFFVVLSCLQVSTCWSLKSWKGGLGIQYVKTLSMLVSKDGIFSFTRRMRLTQTDVFFQ